MHTFPLKKALVGIALLVGGLVGHPGAEQSSATPNPAEPTGIRTFHVQGNVHLLHGGGANVAVQIGEEGVVVVDTGNGQMSDKVLAAIRQLSTKDIRWVVNTHFHPDHTGGNQTISQAGRTVNGNPAAIIAHENVLTRMTEANRPITERPLNSFFEETKDFYFNGEAIFIYHVPGAHTDGDSFVYFRGSDVLVAGDIFVTTTYPVIDAKSGGRVQGFIDGLNTMLDIAVPKRLQEGGTYVIPGHGRIGDEADVLAYRDMMLFVRDRVQALIKKGMTLEQVKAQKPSLDYDTRYGSETGPWTTAMFVEAVYRDLSQKK
ncbi:MAG: MBL fold metallo-hydrolase [Acidobacteria bacterium]|nr:MAG: MBL fold metallo-hydrolase [Acidobacteriota bacterium]